MGKLEEEYDYQNEIEPDEHTLHENMDRSRYFFAMISFLMALIFLGIYLNNYYDVLSGWFLLVGVFDFWSSWHFLFMAQSNTEQPFQRPGSPSEQ